MKIAIIGGSIAGCALAVLLKKKFEVTVFERSKDLQSKGAGITMPKELLQTLIAKGILDNETINYSSSKRSFHYQSANNPDASQYLWQQDISITSLHWDTLFQALRNQLSDDLYKNGCKVTDVTLNEGYPGKITFESGDTQEFDLIVFADGSQSMGRQFISKHSQLEYSGYVAWRGVLDFDSIKDQTPFTDNIPYYCFDTGHLLAYPVHHDGIKKLNWVFYEKIALKDLERFNYVSPLHFSDEAKTYLHQFAKDKLPTAIAQIVIATKAPFIQKVVDISVDKLITKGALLLGDASTVLRPHVGNGASLALHDALNLSQCLCNHNNMQEAITEWEQKTHPNRLSAYALSQRMGDALVLNPVLWQKMNEVEMPGWWEQIIRKENWYTSSSSPK